MLTIWILFKLLVFYFTLKNNCTVLIKLFFSNVNHTVATLQQSRRDKSTLKNQMSYLKTIIYQAYSYKQSALPGGFNTGYYGSSQQQYKQSRSSLFSLVRGGEVFRNLQFLGLIYYQLLRYAVVSSNCNLVQRGSNASRRRRAVSKTHLEPPVADSSPPVKKGQIQIAQTPAEHFNLLPVHHFLTDRISTPAGHCRLLW